MGVTYDVEPAVVKSLALGSLLKPRRECLIATLKDRSTIAIDQLKILIKLTITLRKTKQKQPDGRRNHLPLIRKRQPDVANNEGGP